MTRGRACGSDAPLSQAGTANTAVYSVVKDPGRLWPLKSLAGGSATIFILPDDVVDWRFRLPNGGLRDC